MLKVGLTGGIASGKSTVGEMLVGLGAYLAQADEIAHRLMQPGGNVYRAVIEHFGSDILNSDGTINRPRLAEAAFGSAAEQAAGRPSRIQELNRIVHPDVVQKQDEWMEELGRRDPSAIAVVEAALILEAGAASHFDRLIVVTCSPELRVRRWALRKQVTEEVARLEIGRRMAAQFPEEEKIKAADYLIDNSGSLEQTRGRVREVYGQLRRIAGGEE